MSLLVQLVRWARKQFNGPAPEEAVEVRQEVSPPEICEVVEATVRKGPRQELAEGAEEFGKRLALEGGKVESDKADMATIDAKARSMAQVAHSPASEERDASQRQKLTRVEQAITRREAERDALAANERELGEARGKLGARGEYPKVEWLFRMAAVIGLIIAFSVNIHDLLAGLPGILPWVCAVVCALGVSLLIVHGILPPELPQWGEADGGAKPGAKRQQSTIFAALMIGVAFFLMRVWQGGGGDLPLAVSLTLVEFGAVLFLEAQARKLEPKIAAWHAHENEIDVADARVEEARTDLSKHDRLIEGLVAQRDALEGEIEDDRAMSDLKTLVSIAGDAARAGYFRGISMNAGRISGMARLGVAA